MVLGLVETNDAQEKVKSLCGELPALVRSMRNKFSALNASCVMGFGADAWGMLFLEQPRPAELEVLQEIRGAKYVAVSMPGDFFFTYASQK
ncbi:hypothetical protein AGMMS49925_07000 [Deltaproteobacteria bacterium]|nr:hypothetical protein AGMMS49925_07000 [Deltaproteobacteria bacterium]